MCTCVDVYMCMANACASASTAKWDGKCMCPRARTHPSGMRMYARAPTPMPVQPSLRLALDFVSTPKSDRPLISIILPIHNGVSWLDGCLEALLALQTMIFVFILY